MKVVINRCFGGFGVSTACVMEMIKRDSKALDIEECDDWGEPDMYDRTKLERIKDIEDGYQIDSWFGDLLYKDGKTYTINREYEDQEMVRSDPVLVQIVEEIGDKANGRCAELAVVEIPDDVEWHIEEYDGSECVAENHRTW